MTWWSQEFWISVATTCIGILGSLGIAVLLFWIGRRAFEKDRAREKVAKAAEVERERWLRVAAQLLDKTNDFMVLCVQAVDWEWSCRLTSAMREFMPSLSEGIYVFTGTPLGAQLKELLLSFADVPQRQVVEALERATGAERTEPFQDFLERDAKEMYDKAMKLHRHLLKVIAAIGRAELT